MGHRQKLKRLAHILVEKHDSAAKEVARARLEQSFDSDDYASAHLWTDVAEAVKQIYGDPAEPTTKPDVAPAEPNGASS